MAGPCGLPAKSRGAPWLIAVGVAALSLSTAVLGAGLAWWAFGRDRAEPADLGSRSRLRTSASTDEGATLCRNLEHRFGGSPIGESRCHPK